MPLLIAHRGLMNGPNESTENTISAIFDSRQRGFDVEIDVWFNDGRWFLGHDGPREEIDLDLLRSIDRQDYLDQHHAWIHAKNIEALYELRRIRWEGHIFYHQNDDAVLTNTGFLWTYPGNTLTPLSICVMPEWTDAIHRVKDLDVYAFCSDYVLDIRTSLMR